MELYEHLQRREAAGNPIRLGLVGCGQEGSGMVHITRQMAGLETRVIADIIPQRPLDTFKAIGIPESRIVTTDKSGEAEDALRKGQYVITEDALLLPQLESLDVLVEATGVTEVGAQVAWSSILNQKHIVMLNVETDVTVGLFLHHLAQKVGCVYTVAMGDEPGVCKTLYNFARTLGFEVVCLGKGKNNPIDYDATPESCREEAASKDMNPKMLAAFKDGTKTMVELAAMSNATGLVPDVPGAHGAKVDVEDLNKVFIPKEDGGILSRRGCVDYSTGKVAPGVFAIISTDDPRIVADMKFYSMGPGPYYLLYRPYHLCSIETPLSAAEAVIYGETTLVPKGMVSEVVPIAKRDLKAGDRVGDIGSADIYSTLYTYAEARARKAIPTGLAPGAKILKDIPKGEMLTEENVAPDTTKVVYKLRQMQDALLDMTR
ncbi:MAG: NAD(P)H-dependent oxidoreductase [Anaerolineae bacterium]